MLAYGQTGTGKTYTMEATPSPVARARGTEPVIGAGDATGAERASSLAPSRTSSAHPLAHIHAE